MKAQPGFRITSVSVTLLLLFALLFASCSGRDLNVQPDTVPSTLGVSEGTIAGETSRFTLEVLKSSQTVASLRSNDGWHFDFTPGERLSERDKDGFYHLGDITLGLRSGDTAGWAYYSTSYKRSDVEALATDDTDIIAAADLSATLPGDIPVKVTRYWQKEGNDLVLRFELGNRSTKPVEIGALGIPMVFNNNFNDKTLDQAHAENVFFDPYIGNDAGYLQVVRLNGLNKVLLVVPYGDTPFEAYRPLFDEPTPPGYTFEGLHEWMVHSRAYAETEWKDAGQWNNPTSQILEPGETRSYGVRFLLAGSIREIENTLAAAGRPVAVGIPGYVLPEDVDARLFIKYDSQVNNITVEPEDAVEIIATGTTPHGWTEYGVRGRKWGRARVTVSYADGLSQTINYKIIAPEKEVITSYGRFLTTEQWFDDKDDLFHRAPSVITYDYEVKKQVTQDTRAWIAGLSDEGGAGSWLGAIMKQTVIPEKEEVDKLEDFVNNTIWGGIQYNEGPGKYGVRKSMFYYEPDSMPQGTYSDSIEYGAYGGFPSWNRKEAGSTVRSYNYPHVAAAHWAMYRLARFHKGLVTQQEWNWYLENAFYTVMAMTQQAPYYAKHGQMEGSVFILILNDLKAEGMTDMADMLEAAMKKRVARWKKMKYPFGSEMPWDSTGQEEVYMWEKYFGLDDKALTTLNAVLAYMPSVPHWAYNGNARRIWDFLYGGKLKRFERMIHHYGSGLNAIPVLYHYRTNPSDLYLLRVGYGGVMGTISNITRDGFAPCAFHSFPSTLKNDGITGDYGSGFYGYAVNTATYITRDDEFGWLSFGGNLSEEEGWIKTEMTTAALSRVYIAAEGLWITLDAGQMQTVWYHPESGEVRIVFDKADAFTPEAYMHMSYPAEENTGKYDAGSLKTDGRGAYIIPLGDDLTEISLKKKQK